MTFERPDDADLSQLFKNNQAWAQRMRERDIQFAVDVLKVRHVMVVGHYVCGGVQAVLDRREMGWSTAGCGTWKTFAISMPNASMH